MEKIYGNLRKPARTRRVHAMHLFCRGQEHSSMPRVTLQVLEYEESGMTRTRISYGARRYVEPTVGI
jgi:hypothetical protein